MMQQTEGGLRVQLSYSGKEVMRQQKRYRDRQDLGPGPFHAALGVPSACLSPGQSGVKISVSLVYTEDSDDLPQTVRDMVQFVVRP